MAVSGSSTTACFGVFTEDGKAPCGCFDLEFGTTKNGLWNGYDCARGNLRVVDLKMAVSADGSNTCALTQVFHSVAISIIAIID